MIFPPLPTERNIGYVVLFRFSPKQRAFLERHDISISDGYIGMLRAYHKNRTVWQTSLWVPVFGALEQSHGGAKVDWEALNQENVRLLHAWVDELMALGEDEIAARLAVHVPFLS